MKRVIIPKPGGYERLEVIEQSDPRAGPGEVLVDVHAIGVNYADCIIRMGLYSSAKKYVGYPITPGFDFSGEVVAVGSGVDASLMGNKVVGVTRFGAYQSKIAVSARQVFALPEGWSYQRGAALPTVNLTAWYSLCELCRPRPGQWVLVHTAAGGVGTAALSMCQHLGLRTVAVVGKPEKVETARAAGAHHVVVRQGQDYWKRIEEFVPGGFDVVLEASGVTTLRQSYRHLRPTGRMIVFGMGTLLPSGERGVNWLKLAWRYLQMPRFSPLDMLDGNKTVSAFNLSYLFEEQDRLQAAMNQLLQWAQAGHLAEPPLRSFALDEVREAHRALESGQTVGKLVLIP